MGANGMKPESVGPGKTGQRRTPVRIPQIPMEWMDPMSWRLPSGKALAEFALQAGFLAPLMMGTPRLKKRKIPAPAVNPAITSIVAADKRVKEAPEHSGTFREGRF
jgi:hypothetical protein